MSKFNSITDFLLKSTGYNNIIVCAQMLFSGKHGHRKFLLVLVWLGIINEEYFPNEELRRLKYVKYWRRLVVTPDGQKLVRYTVHFNKRGLLYLLKVIANSNNFSALLKLRCSELLNQIKNRKNGK